MDTCYQLKHIAKDLASLDTNSDTDLKHFIKYVVGTKEIELILFVRKMRIDNIKNGRVFVDRFADAGWAKGLKGRLSSSASLTYVDNLLCETSCMAQEAPALSSGEAELYASGTASRDNLHVRAHEGVRIQVLISWTYWPYVYGQYGCAWYGSSYGTF